MITSLNYQVIVELVATYIMISLPIGILFGLAGKLINMFLSAVFGDKTIKM